MSEINFEQECKNQAQYIANSLLAIYEGRVESENDDYDGDKMTLREYFDDYLDVDYYVNSNKEYNSVVIWITLGGPNICVNTKDAEVQLFWGGTKETAPITYSVRDEIDEIFQEIYDYS